MQIFTQVEKWQSHNVWESLCESEIFALELDGVGGTNGWKSWCQNELRKRRRSKIYTIRHAKRRIWSSGTKHNLHRKKKQKFDFWALQRLPVPKLYKTKSLVRAINGHREERSQSDTKLGLLGLFMHFPYVLCMPLPASSQKGTVEKRPWGSLKYSQWSIWANLR